MRYDAMHGTDDLETLLEREGPIWLFKHSTRCPFSAEAFDEVRRYKDRHPDEQLMVLIVQHDRRLNRHVADRLGVRHESPQLFLLDRGEVCWHGSHGEITAEAMERQCESLFARA